MILPTSIWLVHMGLFTPAMLVPVDVGKASQYNKKYKVSPVFVTANLSFESIVLKIYVPTSTNIAAIYRQP